MLFIAQHVPEEAQWAIGQLHPIAESPFSIVLDEGFDADTYIDVFDGGPTVQERLAMLKTVSRARLLRIRESDADAATAFGLPWHLVINSERERFRAVLVLSLIHI